MAASKNITTIILENICPFLMKKISIILPIYNSEKYLHDCLDSIYNENPNLHNFEVIAVNDGSTDNSLSILNEYSEKYSNFFVFSKQNEGQSIARNLAISKANGEYLMCIDSDDNLEKGALAKLIQLISDIKTDIIGYNAHRIHNKKRKKYGSQTYPHSKTLSMADFMEKFAYQGVLWKYLFKRSLIDLHNIEMIPKIFHQDEAFVTKSFYFARDISFIDLDVYQYHIRKNSSITKNEYCHRLKLGDDLFVVLNSFLKLKSENQAPAKQHGLTRKINFYSADIVISLLRYRLDEKYTKKKLAELEKHGLFPIDAKELTWKYKLFAFFFRNKTVVLSAAKLGLKP